ncbi:MAG: hypothetical protein U0169_18970 [Polyangiaceae bacterium]
MGLGFAGVCRGVIAFVVLATSGCAYLGSPFTQQCTDKCPKSSVEPRDYDDCMAKCQGRGR